MAAACAALLTSLRACAAPTMERAVFPMGQFSPTQEIVFEVRWDMPCPGVVVHRARECETRAGGRFAGKSRPADRIQADGHAGVFGFSTGNAVTATFGMLEEIMPLSGAKVFVVASIADASARGKDHLTECGRFPMLESRAPNLQGRKRNLPIVVLTACRRGGAARVSSRCRHGEGAAGLDR